jgi:hypothetical protein
MAATEEPIQRNPLVRAFRHLAQDQVRSQKNDELIRARTKAGKPATWSLDPEKEVPPVHLKGWGNRPSDKSE